MDLQKRDCPVKIELFPSGIQYLTVVWKIAEDRYEFLPSSHVGGQFSLLIQALYGLYAEGDDLHNHFDRPGTRLSHALPCEDKSLKEDELAIMASLDWDNEGEITTVSFRRVCRYGEDSITKEHDPVLVTITDEDGKSWIYTVEGRDLCYAAAKAYTGALKKYGIYGYAASTGSRCFECGDCVDMHMLLFLKARALGVKEPRVLLPVDEDGGFGPVFSSFDNEIELLLFDM